MKKVLPWIILVIAAGVGGYFIGAQSVQCDVPIEGSTSSVPSPINLGSKNFANLTQEERDAKRALALEGGVAPEGLSNRDMSGIATGEVLSINDTSMTVNLSDGGTKLIFLGSDITVQRLSDQSIEDVTTGDVVIVRGDANDDGSITASTIQLNPAE